jgi:hypothetical protein
VEAGARTVATRTERRQVRTDHARQWLLGFLLALLVTVIVGHRMMTDYASGVLDLYPVYWGAHAWVTGGNAYDLATVQPHLHGHLALLSDVGNVYPMHAVLLFAPLALLPPKIASCAYLLLLLGGLGYLIHRAKLSVAVLLFAPLVIAVATEQLAVLVLLAQLSALIALRSRRRGLTAAALVVCSIKPTQTALFMVLVLWEDRRNLRFHLRVLLAVLGISLLAQPDWPIHWVHAALARNSHFPGQVHWLWWAAPMAVAAWQWRDRVGAVTLAQIALTPSPLKLYAFAPLMLDATSGARAWVVALGQLAVWPLWSTNPALAVTIGLLLPRLLSAAPIRTTLAHLRPARRSPIREAGATL